MQIFNKFLEWFLTTWFLLNLLALWIQFLSMKTTQSMFLTQNILLKVCYLNLNKFLFLQIRKNFNQATSLLHINCLDKKLNKNFLFKIYENDIISSKKSNWPFSLCLTNLMTSAPPRNKELMTLGCSMTLSLDVSSIVYDKTDWAIKIKFKILRLI